MKNSHVQILQVPYDSGNRDVRMGKGPEHLMTSGLEEVLQATGFDIRTEIVESTAEFQSENQTQFELYRLLAARVSQARDTNRFPLILSGNCGASIAAIAGSQAQGRGTIWFDAHGDFNTPETTEGGFLDGMALAIAAGLCWKKLAAAIPNFTPLTGEFILHLGGRFFDSEERALFDDVGATVIDADAINLAGTEKILLPALTKFAFLSAETHLHIDLDVFNPIEAPANGYVTEEGGLGIEQLIKAIKLIKNNIKITSATIAAFDPVYDTHGKTVQAAFRLIKTILE